MCKNYDLSPLRDKIEDAIEAIAILQAAHKDLTGQVWIPPIRLAPRKRKEAPESAIEEIAILRELLWLNHGHLGLYGDDGEKQCGTCMIDFKRTPASDIKHRFDMIDFKRTPASDIKHRFEQMALAPRKRMEARECECNSPSYPLGPCVNCGGLSRLT